MNNWITTVIISLINLCVITGKVISNWNEMEMLITDLLVLILDWFSVFNTSKHINTVHINTHQHGSFLSCHVVDEDKPIWNISYWRQLLILLWDSHSVVMLNLCTSTHGRPPERYVCAVVIQVYHRFLLPANMAHGSSTKLLMISFWGPAGLDLVCPGALDDKWLCLSWAGLLTLDSLLT